MQAAATRLAALVLTPATDREEAKMHTQQHAHRRAFPEAPARTEGGAAVPKHYCSRGGSVCSQRDPGPTAGEPDGEGRERAVAGRGRGWARGHVAKHCARLIDRA